MSEIETREGVDLEKLVQTVRRGLGLSYSCIVDVPECEDEHAPAFAGLDALNLITAELRAARTPAQTQTFKDGFAAGLEAAAKEVDEEHQQHAFTMFGWVLHRLAKSIRALKEPS